MPRREKFFEMSLQALSPQNRTWDGVGSEGEEEEDAPKWRGFRDGVDIRLGAITQLTKKKDREKERQAEKHQHNQYIKI